MKKTNTPTVITLFIMCLVLIFYVSVPAFLQVAIAYNLQNPFLKTDHIP